MSYETHITCAPENKKAVQDLCKSLDWKFSAIDGDPLLGDKVFIYLTAHTTSILYAIKKLETCRKALVAAKVEILREKIENIVYDTKTGTGLALVS